MPVSYTDRGFANYARFKDTAGTEVIIRQSSVATYSAVWIFGAGTLRNPGCALHLDADRARTVIAALQEWLDSLADTPAAAANGGHL